MSRDILSEFGPESPQPQASRLENGGKPSERDVMDYQPPTGPIGIMHNAGRGSLNGVNFGNCGSQGKYTDPRGGRPDVPKADGGAGRPGDLNTSRTLLGGTQNER